jgi:hypothetical protein
MGLDVRVDGAVRRPAEEVAAYLFDASHDPEWIGGIREVEPPATGVEVGTRVARVATFMGRRIDYVLEVAELIPGRRLAMRSVKAPFPMNVTYEIAPEGDGSRVALGVSGGSYGMRLFEPLVAAMVRRNLRADLRRLRRRLER